ncbi:Smr-domain-containing protein [Auriscalpium vulgare]|uniref:Smr-domain-containing protein n=1 Tax=Auriscalpium vulgare TaxID=40419 RepID=A0ACB8S5Q7_9AGAM|nr:Smr-domain-containing protein [Auriscalpium vulgare]
MATPQAAQVWACILKFLTAFFWVSSSLLAAYVVWVVLVLCFYLLRLCWNLCLILVRRLWRICLAPLRWWRERAQAEQDVESRAGQQICQQYVAPSQRSLLVSAPAQHYHVIAPPRSTSSLLASAPVPHHDTITLPRPLLPLAPAPAAPRAAKAGKKKKSKSAPKNEWKKSLALAQSWRKYACSQYDLQKALFAEAEQAGDAAHAHALAQRARAAKREVAIWDDKSAELTFKSYNFLRKVPKGMWDLHDLRVEEAEQYVAEYLDKALKRGDSQIRFIVGKGKRSKSGGPKIKPAVAKLVANRGLRFYEEPSNTGILVVNLE